MKRNVLFVLLFICVHSVTFAFPAKVVGIKDGDTIS